MRFGSRSRLLAAAVVVVLGLGALVLGRRPAASPASSNRQAATASRLDSTGAPAGLDGDDAATIAGSVRHADGTPAPGAHVMLVRARAELAAPGAFFSPPMAVRDTSADGTFSFVDLPPGGYVLTATHAEALPAASAQVDVVPGAHAELELRLGGPGVLLTGRVLDATGGPVPGAGLFFARLDGGATTPTAFSASADDQGRFRVMLAPGPYFARAEASGYAPATQPLEVRRATAHDFRLVPGARLSGRVVEGQARTPVAGAEVIARTPGSVFASGQTVRTAADGSFAFAALEAGTYQLVARAGGRLAIDRDPIDLGPTDAVEGRELGLEPAATIKGHVRVQGPPAGGTDVEAEVMLLPREDASLAPRTAKATARDGFSFEGIPPGAYRLMACSAGHGRAFRDLAVTTNDMVLDLALIPGARVAGRVVDGGGQPVASAQVSGSVVAEGAGQNSTARATTQVDGRFVLDNLTAGQLRVVVEKPGYGPTAAGPFTLQVGDNPPLSLRVSGGAVVTGRVTQADGQPAAGIVVQATSSAGIDDESALRATTGPDGAYRLGPLPVGQVIIAVDRPGQEFQAGETAPSDQRELQLAEGEARSGVDLVLPKLGQTVGGVVRDPEGRPVELATVMIGRETSRTGSSNANPEDKTLTDGDGRFEFTNLAEGTFTLWVTHPQFADLRRAQVRSGAKDVVLQCARGATIAGVATDGAGRVVTDYTVAAVKTGGTGASDGDADHSEPQRVHDAQGRFTLRKLSSGHYELHVIAQDGRTGRQVIYARPDEQRSDVRVILGEAAPG